MKHLIQKIFVAAFAVGMAGLVGCEWSGGSSDNSWNDSSSIANFNGTYQGNGGYLVSEYSLSSISSGSGVIYSDVTGEGAGSGASGNSTFSGVVANKPIKPGSLTLTLSGDLGSFRDNGSGVLTGQYHTRTGDSFLFTGTGTIDYNNGQWTLTLEAGAPLGQAATFSTSYSYSAGGTAGSGSSVGTPGSSGKTIYAFNVQQTGNSLKIVDNNGCVYSGSLGDVRTTGNVGTASQGALFVDGDQVMASFSASGTSAAGIHVNLVGTFQGTVSGVSQVSSVSSGSVTYNTSMALSSRVMTGTWVEDGGKSGSINGVCPSAAMISLSSSTSTNTP